VPQAYEPDAVPVPGIRRYRQTSPLLPGDRLPRWLVDRPAGRPLVLVAFGTITPGLAAWRDAVGAIVAGLGEVDCTVVVLGGGLPGTPPANVRLVDWLPQPLVLECCDLFVTHGGFNSVREALRLGVPMVIVPWLTDQPANAARCAQLGVARAIDPDELTPAAVSGACTCVLEDPAYRRRAATIRRHMLALPGLDVLVSDLEAIVTDQRREFC
jgi:N-glycosyltransferase